MVAWPEGGGNTGIRPAIITHVWGDDDRVNLAVFVDVTFDRDVVAGPGPYLAAKVPYDPDLHAMTWCWPPRV